MWLTSTIEALLRLAALQRARGGMLESAVGFLIPAESRPLGEARPNVTRLRSIDIAHFLSKSRQ